MSVVPVVSPEGIRPIDVDHEAADDELATNTCPLLGVPLTVTPSMVLEPPLGVLHPAAVEEVAVKTWPLLLGEPATVTPLAARY